jgi:hypothetical protein
MRKITTTIERQWLAEIIDGSKKVEYREIKPYWERRLAGITAPFVLRLINGMHAKAPEVTVLVGKVRMDRRNREYQLHIAKVLRHKNWNKRQRQPTHPFRRRQK